MIRSIQDFRISNVVGEETASRMVKTEGKETVIPYHALCCPARTVRELMELVIG